MIPPTGPKLPDACEWGDCHRQATFRWHAAWSIADFVDYWCCGRHWLDMGKALSAETVDGIEVQELYSDKLELRNR